jgi:uncharacterized protein with FMN-binding domain
MADKKQPSKTDERKQDEGAGAKPLTPRQARQERRKQRRRKRTGTVLTFVLVVLLGLGTLGYIECIHSTPGPSNDVTKGIVLGPVEAGKYTDGIMKGRSKRWHVRVRVKLHFLRGRIERIDVTQHRTFWPKAKRATDEIVRRILAKQNTDVKAVSGATLSSQALMLAVQDALNNNHEEKVQEYERTGEGGRWEDKF